MRASAVLLPGTKLRILVPLQVEHERICRQLRGYFEVDRAAYLTPRRVMHSLTGQLDVQFGSHFLHEIGLEIRRHDWVPLIDQVDFLCCEGPI